MKSKIIVLFAFALMLLSAPVSADTCTSSGMVVGQVYDEDNIGISGADVSAVCEGGNVSNTVQTNDLGNYVICINCSEGSTVTVTAEKDGMINTGSDVMEDWTCIDIAFIDILLTPEFSMIMIPFIMSLAGFVLIRGKSLI